MARFLTENTTHSCNTNECTNTQCNENYCLQISLWHALVSEQFYIQIICSLGLHSCPPLFLLDEAGLESNSSPPDTTLFRLPCSTWFCNPIPIYISTCLSYWNLLWTGVSRQAILKYFYESCKHSFAGQQATVKVSISTIT